MTVYDERLRTLLSTGKLRPNVYIAAPPRQYAKYSAYYLNIDGYIRRGYDVYIIYPGMKPEDLKPIDPNGWQLFYDAWMLNRYGQ